MKPHFSPSCDRLCVKMADRFASRRYSLKNKLGDGMIKQLLNYFIAKYRDLSVSRRSIICLSLRLRQIIDLLATEKSRYFGQPRPIIANYFCNEFTFLLIGFTRNDTRNVLFSRLRILLELHWVFTEIWNSMSNSLNQKLFKKYSDILQPGQICQVGEYPCVKIHNVVGTKRPVKN